MASRRPPLAPTLRCRLQPSHQPLAAVPHTFLASSPAGQLLLGRPRLLLPLRQHSHRLHTMHRPSFMRSASSKAPPPPSPDRGPPDESLTPRPPGAPTLPHPRPAASTRATLTSNISKGFAALAGTAATVGGNVGHYAKAAVKGDATVLGGDEGGWRDSFGGWVGRKRSASSLPSAPSPGSQKADPAYSSPQATRGSARTSCSSSPAGLSSARSSSRLRTRTERHRRPRPAVRPPSTEARHPTAVVLRAPR